MGLARGLKRTGSGRLKWMKVWGVGLGKRVEEKAKKRERENARKGKREKARKRDSEKEGGREGEKAREWERETG